VAAALVGNSMHNENMAVNEAIKIKTGQKELHTKLLEKNWIRI
jgi:hypothetical protein